MTTPDRQEEALRQATREVIGDRALTISQSRFVDRVLDVHRQSAISQFGGRGAGKTTAYKIIARYFQIYDEQDPNCPYPWETK